MNSEKDFSTSINHNIIKFQRQNCFCRDDNLLANLNIAFYNLHTMSSLTKLFLTILKTHPTSLLAILFLNTKWTNWKHNCPLVPMSAGLCTEWSPTAFCLHSIVFNYLKCIYPCIKSSVQNNLIIELTIQKFIIFKNAYNSQFS